MSQRRAEELLRELARRVSRLRCLAVPTRRLLTHHLATFATEEQLEAYLTGGLAFIEREIEPVNHGAFRRLKSNLASLADPGRILSALGADRMPLTNICPSDAASAQAAADAWLNCARNHIFIKQSNSSLFDLRGATRCYWKVGSADRPGLVDRVPSPAAAWLYCLANHYGLSLSPPRAESQARAVSWLAFSLVGLGEYPRAKRVLDRHAGVDAAHYANVRLLRSAIAVVTAPLSVLRAREIITVWAGALRVVGMAQEAAWVEDLYARSEVGAAGTPVLAPPEPWVVFVHARTPGGGSWGLCKPVQDLSRHPKPGASNRARARIKRLLGLAADPLLDVCSKDAVGPSQSPATDQSEVADSDRLVKFAFYLLSSGDFAPDAIQVCGNTIGLLRDFLSKADLPRDQRLLRAEQAAGIRRLVRQIASAWAARSGENQLRKQAVLWDCEIGQRVLVERYLAGGEFAAAGTDAAGPVPDWPFRSARRAWPGHRPARSSIVLPRAAATIDALDSSQAAAQGIPEGGQFVPALAAESLSQLRALVSAPVDEGRLARALGPQTVFLRAGLDLAGRLYWTALWSDGQRLGVLADNGPGADPTDRERLVWAAAHHDLRLAFAYLDPGRAAAVRQVFIDEAGDLGGFVRESGGFPAKLAEGISLRLDDLRERLSAEGYPEEVRWVGQCVDVATRAALRPPEDVSELSDWVERAAAQWQKVLDLVQSDPAPGGLVASLNRATELFIREVGAVWNLDRLAPSLPRDSHVVVQVEDVLHALPVAHLPVAGRPFWQRARSIGSSLTPLLDYSQEVTDSSAGRGLSNLLVVSSFAPHDETVREGAIDLHHGQANLAERHGLPCYAAAEEPPGTLETLLTGLTQRGYVAATVYGHGDARQAALRIAARAGAALWRGRGLDLSGVEFLLLPSCSIGRLRDSGTRDVEGLCVELALHGARSTLCCRWPVQCQLAADVTNEVLHHYLLLREEDNREGAGRLRALALNRARDSLLADGDGALYLSTLAAFELYGSP